MGQRYRALGLCALLAVAASTCSRPALRVEARDVSQAIVAVALPDPRRAPDELGRLASRLGPLDLGVLLVRNPSRTVLGQDSLRAALDQLAGRSTRARLAVLTAGIENVRFLAETLPDSVDWLGYEYAPGREPEFARTRRQVIENLNLAGAAVRASGRRYFVVCPLEIVMPSRWIRADLTPQLIAPDLFFVELPDRPSTREAARIADSLEARFAGRSAFFFQVLLGPGGQSPAATRPAASAAYAAGADGFYLVFPPDQPDLAGRFLDILRGPR